MPPVDSGTATMDGREVSTLDVLVDRAVDGKAVETWAYSPGRLGPGLTPQTGRAGGPRR
jgi:hypothetical protein